MNSQDSKYSLTPLNAPEAGFEWVQDIIYDPEAPAEAMQGINELLDEGYKIGNAASEASEGLFVGLYKPLNS